MAVLAALGGVGQAARADGASRAVRQLREEAHEEAAREIRRVRDEARGFSKDERIESFLRGREPAADRDDGLRRLLLHMEVCGPGQGVAGGARNRDADFRRSYSDTGQKSHPLQHKADAASTT